MYRDFWNDQNKFHNSDNAENSPFCDTIKKRIGCLKDEASGVIIKEFIGLRRKVYSYIKDKNENNKTAKGLKKIVIKNEIKHYKDYKNTLFNNKQMYHTMKTIPSEHHQLGSYKSKQSVFAMLR